MKKEGYIQNINKVQNKYGCGLIKPPAACCEMSFDFVQTMTYDLSHWNERHGK